MEDKKTLRETKIQCIEDGYFPEELFYADSSGYYIDIETGEPAGRFGAPEPSLEKAMNEYREELRKQPDKTTQELLTGFRRLMLAEYKKASHQYETAEETYGYGSQSYREAQTGARERMTVIDDLCLAFDQVVEDIEKLENWEKGRRPY